MICPECQSELELCENPKCEDSPHWACSAFLGCGFSMPATSEEIAEFRWPKQSVKG